MNPTAHTLRQGMELSYPFYSPIRCSYPLIQHFFSYDGPTVNQTSVRLIGIQSFPRQIWDKLDARVSFDWENDTVPASFELQVAKMLAESFGLYVDGLVGLASDRPYDYGLGLGLRLLY